LRKDKLKKSIREPFEGVVVHVEYPCTCETCQRGTEALIQIGRTERNRLHIAMKPISVYSVFQHTWFNYSELKWSAMGALTYALNDLCKFTPKSETIEGEMKELKKYMLGQAFKFESWTAIDFVKMRTIVEEVNEGKARDEVEREIEKVVKRLPPALKEAREVWLPVKKLMPQELEFYGITDLSEFYREAREEYGAKEKEVLGYTVEELEL